MIFCTQKYLFMIFFYICLIKIGEKLQKVIYLRCSVNFCFNYYDYYHEPIIMRPIEMNYKMTKLAVRFNYKSHIYKES